MILKRLRENLPLILLVLIPTVLALGARELNQHRANDILLETQRLNAELEAYRSEQSLVLEEQRRAN